MFHKLTYLEKAFRNISKQKYCLNMTLIPCLTALISEIVRNPCQNVHHFESYISEACVLTFKQVSKTYSNLHNYFNLHFCSSFHSCHVPSYIPAVISQNNTNESFLICVKSEKICILGHPQDPEVHEVRQRQVMYITLLGKAEVAVVFYHLPSVVPEQLCVLAHLGCTCKAGTSQSMKKDNESVK